jgi:DNA-binding beta-propeller fold protein YncE
MNLAAATVISTGLNGIDQIALDEAHGFAYVAEFTGGNIQRINLVGGARTAVASVFTPRGVLVTDDGRFLYVSSDDGNIRRFDLATTTNVVVASGLTAPRYLRFADAGESTILFPTVDGSVHLLDLIATPPLVRTIAGPATSNPISVAVLLRTSY